MLGLHSWFYKTKTRECEVRQDEIVEIKMMLLHDTYFAMKYADSRYAPELLSLKMILRSRGKAMYEVNMASKT